MRYFIKTPWILKKYYNGCIWSIPTKKKIIYLTFDDGPHPLATPFILGILKNYQARATFFCIGKNVMEEPALYRKILEDGHRVGNHTHNHLNGWKTPDKLYFQNISEAAKYIDSDLFRPPYGRVSRFQMKHLRMEPFNYRIVMWNILSADFDQRLTGNQCAFHVIGSASPGSIVIFHDSAKAYDRMRVALPKVLEYFSDKGYSFESIR